MPSTQTHRVWKEGLSSSRQMHLWHLDAANQTSSGAHSGKWEILLGSRAKHSFWWILFILNSEAASEFI